MPVIDLKETTIKIKDAGVNEVEIKIGEGNLTYSEKRNIEYFKDRGNLDLVREGDEEPVDLSFDFVWEWLRTNNATVTVEEALKQTGAAAAWASTGGTCEPYAVDLELIYNPTCGTTQSEKITFSEFRYEQLDHDLRAGTVSASGKCNETAPTVERIAST